MEVENDYQYIVKARFNNKTKLIFLKELSLDNFLNECKKNFHIQSATAFIKLTDQDNATIPYDQQMFVITVKNYQRCSSFCIKLDVETTEEDEPPLIVTPDVRKI